MLDKIAQTNFYTSASTPYIYDAHNRVSVFHGINGVTKGFPWYEEDFRNDSVVKEIASWGFNSVRLGVMWSGAEPVEGEFNTTYFDILGEIITRFNDNGIYVYLDMHQDAASTKYCMEYDGFPMWFINYAAEPEHAIPWPLEWDGVNPCPYDRSWSKNYFQEACSVFFQSFYSNYNGMRDKFNKYWAKVADYFKDYPLLGYEIVNEPWAGDIYSDPTLLLPGQAGIKNLMPLYNEASAAIRAVDPDHIIFYEPVTWGMIFNGSILGSGFDTVPGGPDWAHKSVYSFHYYCWWYNGENPSDVIKKTCDDVFGPKVLNQVDRDIHRTGGSAMLTEWGQGCDPYDTNSTSECTAIMDNCDQHFMSWSSWYFGYQVMNHDWVIPDESLTVFARTYARRIAGVPTVTRYDAVTKDFKLCFDPTTPSKDSVNGLDSVSEIFYHSRLHYPLGVSVEVSPQLELMSTDNDLILVRNRFLSTEEKAKLPKNACITITAKSS